MPRNGFCSLSGTSSQSVSRWMKSVVVVGAHRAAEDRSAGMFIQGLGQRLAQRRAANVEFVAARPQVVTDAPRRRHFLMQHDQDRPVLGTSEFSSRNRAAHGLIRNYSPPFCNVVLRTAFTHFF